MYNSYNNTIEHCKENNICRVRELMMSNHRYRQESQVKEIDETKKKDTVYKSTEEPTGYREVEYRQEHKDKEADQMNKTDSVYESAEETTAYHELGEFHDISNYDKLS